MGKRDVQRKVFRIEQTFERRRTAIAAPTAPVVVGHEPGALQSIVAAHRQELAALIGAGTQSNLVRAAGDLGAAVEGIDEAARTILEATESIDADAELLIAGLTSDGERALARDIRDRAARIFESCSFHDLAGQRIGKAIALLSALEERLSAMLAGCDGIEAAPLTTTEPQTEPDLINGPKLDGDSGHVSQYDIDRMFG